MLKFERKTQGSKTRQVVFYMYEALKLMKAAIDCGIIRERESQTQATSLCSFITSGEDLPGEKRGDEWWFFMASSNQPTLRDTALRSGARQPRSEASHYHEQSSRGAERHHVSEYSSIANTILTWPHMPTNMPGFVRIAIGKFWPRPRHADR